MFKKIVIFVVNIILIVHVDCILENKVTTTWIVHIYFTIIHSHSTMYSKTKETLSRPKETSISASNESFTAGSLKDIPRH